MRKKGYVWIYCHECLQGRAVKFELAKKVLKLSASWRVKKESSNITEEQLAELEEIIKENMGF